MLVDNSVVDIYRQVPAKYFSSKELNGMTVMASMVIFINDAQISEYKLNFG